MVEPSGNERGTLLPEHRNHPRTFHEHRYVYPVVSRRSRGLSIGINLNPDKICNFDCIYCQVNRRVEAETLFVDDDRVYQELDAILDLVLSGRLFEDDAFRNVPVPLRRLNDIAFSGDGEPTSFRNFAEIVRKVAALKARRGLDDVKLVVITNASLFHRTSVRAALAEIDASGGELWAKLDAGTSEYFERIERTRIPFAQVLRNLADAARVRPLVIQSLFLELDGEPPSESEIAAYCGRLEDILKAGGAIDRVQVYTVARPPAESSVRPLTGEQVDQIAQTVRDRVGLRVESYHGSR